MADSPPSLQTVLDAAYWQHQDQGSLSDADLVELFKDVATNDIALKIKDLPKDLRQRDYLSRKHFAALSRVIALR